MKINSNKIEGQCLCGSIHFTISEPLRDIIVCHCNQCQQWHGQAAFYSQAKINAIAFDNDESLKWYRASSQAERGFCLNCGSSLFWRLDNSQHLSITAGCLSQHENLSVVAHIYCEDRPEYDIVDETLPCYAGTSAGKFDLL